MNLKKKKLKFLRIITIGLLVILMISTSMIMLKGHNRTVKTSLVDNNELNMKVQGNLIYIFVNSTIYNALNSSLTQFQTDLKLAGYTVAFVNYSATAPSRQLDAWNLRGQISQIFNTLPNLEGVIFVGKMPYMEYQVGGPPAPCDLFFMDLDGQWNNYIPDPFLDNHSDWAGGDRAPEIWVGRIDPWSMNIGGDIVAITQYFMKNHLYRTAQLIRPDSALLYIDDDWTPGTWTSEWIGELINAYTNQTVIANNASTNDVSYEKELLNQYEWVHLFVHSFYNQHQFKTGGVVVGTTNWNEIRIMNTQPLFYLLFACSACDFSQIQNIGTEYLFTTNTLGVIGSTKPGGMYEPSQFYTPLGKGASLGVAFINWFINSKLSTSGLNSPINSYGMVILGDPTLEIKYGPINTPPNLSPLVGSDKNVTLQWSDAPDAAVYYIYRNTIAITDITSLQPIGRTFGNSFRDIVPQDATYYYVVVPCNSYANGCMSNCENITITTAFANNIPGFEFHSVIMTLIIFGTMALFLKLPGHSKNALDYHHFFS